MYGSVISGMRQYNQRIRTPSEPMKIPDLSPLFLYAAIITASSFVTAKATLRRCIDVLKMRKERCL